MEKNVKINWLEKTSSKGTTYEVIEYVFEDENGEPIVLSQDFNLNDIKRYVLKQLGIEKVKCN